MRLGNLVPALLVLAVALAFVPNAAALEDPNPALNEWVETTLEIEQPDLTTLEISGQVLVRKYVVEGTVYRTSDDMGKAYDELRQADQFEQAQGRTSDRAGEFVADLEQSTRDALWSTLNASFAGATVVVDPARVDMSTLTPPAGDPYDPGVVIDVTASVQRTLEDLGLAGFTEDAVQVVFDAGAVVTTDLDFRASPGHDVTYILSPPASPAGLSFRDAKAAPGIAAIADGALRVAVDNSAGAAQRAEPVSFAMVNEPALARAPTAEDFRTSVAIALGELKAGQRSMPIDIEVGVSIAAVDVAERFADALPANAELAFLSADAIRALYQEDVITAADLASAEDGIRATVEGSLASFLPGAEVTGGFDMTKLAAAPARPFGTSPPLGLELVASAPYTLPEGGENADLALRIGAALEFSFDLQGSDSGPTEFSIAAPPGTAFVGADNATSATSGAQVPAGETRAVKLTLRDPAAKRFTKADADTGASFGVVLDLKDVDISITKAAGGDLGNILGDVRVEARLGVFEIPADMKGSLPSNVKLDYLSSDALRLLVERGVVTAQQVDDMEKAFRDNVTKNLKGALQTAITVQGGLDRASLDAAQVGAVLSGDKPILMSATASFAKPLSGAPAPSAAMALYTQTQSFDLPSVQGLRSSYKVILPPGLAVNDLKVTNGEGSTGSEDGRDSFEVTPDQGKTAKATVAMAVTPSFVIAKFWPVLLLAVLVIFLLVGSPIAFVVLRRRRKKAQKP